MKRYREICLWSRLSVPAALVRTWLARPAAQRRLLPPWGDQELSRPGGWEEQQELSDEEGGAACRLTSWLRIAPGGSAAPGTEGPLRLLTFRHRQLARDLARHQRLAGNGPPLTVAITGASGFIGSALASFLEAGGHTVRALIRRPVRDPAREIAWDPQRGTIDGPALAGVDAVVNLAGESIADGRWTEARKRRMRESRVRGTDLLARTLAALPRPPRVLVSGSAMGYYGMQARGPVSESAPAGDDFLAQLASDWEQAARPAADLGIRLVHPRTANVLHPGGGALAKLLPIYRAGLGGKLGDGRQPFPWVTLDDAIGAIHQALLDPTLHGPFNLVAPQPCSNAEFSQALADALHRPNLFFVPGWALKMGLGELAGALLNGPTVLPARLQAAGFPFLHPQLLPALAELLGTFIPPEPLADQDQRLTLQVQ